MTRKLSDTAKRLGKAFAQVIDVIDEFDFLQEMNPDDVAQPRKDRDRRLQLIAIQAGYRDFGDFTTHVLTWFEPMHDLPLDPPETALHVAYPLNDTLSGITDDMVAYADAEVKKHSSALEAIRLDPHKLLLVEDLESWFVHIERNANGWKLTDIPGDPVFPTWEAAVAAAIADAP